MLHVLADTLAAGVELGLLLVGKRQLNDLLHTGLADQAGHAYEQAALTVLAAELGALIRENLVLKGQVSKLNDELSAKEKSLKEIATKTPDYNEEGYFKNLQSAMRDSLISAQRVADEATTAAKAEAARVVEDAKAEAAKILDNAQAEAAKVTESAQSSASAAKAEYESLKAAGDNYRANFRKLVEEQLQVLKANDILFK